MKTKLLAAALALSVSFGSLAEWSVNTHGVPVVSEVKDFNKVMALYGVCEQEIPVIALGDLKLPAEANGKELTFKVRIDKDKIHTVQSVVTDIGGGMLGVYVQQDLATFKKLLSGSTIRIQFKADKEGQYIVETYTLEGITLAYQNAGALCDMEFFQEESADDFFEI